MIGNNGKRSLKEEIVSPSQNFTKDKRINNSVFINIKGKFQLEFVPFGNIMKQE